MGKGDSTALAASWAMNRSFLISAEAKPPIDNYSNNSSSGGRLINTGTITYMLMSSHHETNPPLSPWYPFEEGTLGMTPGHGL